MTAVSSLAHVRFVVDGGPHRRISQMRLSPRLRPVAVSARLAP